MGGFSERMKETLGVGFAQRLLLSSNLGRLSLAGCVPAEPASVSPTGKEYAADVGKNASR